MKTNINIVFLLFIIGLATALSAGSAAADDAVDVIYNGGTIITMDSSDQIAEAVAVTKDKIVAVGKHDDIMQFAESNTKIVNLENATLLPGFYDGHSHFKAVDDPFVANLNSPPIGKMENIDDIIAVLTEKVRNTQQGDWVQGAGYDDTLLAEKRHPNRWDLDKISAEHPIYIIHISYHFAVANSAALKLADITKDTPDPVGSVIRKDPATGEPTGVLEEAPAMGLVAKLIPESGLEERLQRIEYASKVYAAKGVTTANNGLATFTPSGYQVPTIPDLQEAVAQDLLKVRVVSWPVLEVAKAAYDIDLNTNMLKMGGVKDFSDGSIQGYTGYLSEPYYVQPEGKSDYRGFPRHPRDVLVQRLKDTHCAGYQSIVHANGDAAIDDVLYAWEQAQKACPRKDPRFVVIHSQMAREDQLDKMKELGAIPSFFTLHTYYWGDRHWNIFMGPDRAARMSPAKSAVDREMPFTIHCDTPVVPIDPLFLIWSAVNRESTGGNIIGEEQRITPLEALRATTIYAAYQNFEEDVKGSIEPGKLADFVILSANPLEVSPSEIKDIKVLETIVGGNTVYNATP